MVRNLKDKKITIYKREGILSGGVVKNLYKPIHTGKLWAYVRQLSVKEFYAAAAQQIAEEILFQVNWLPDFTAIAGQGLFIDYRGEWYNVTRVDTFEGNKDDIKLYGKSERRPGAGEFAG